MSQRKLNRICFAMPSKDFNALLRQFRKVGYTVNRTDISVTIKEDKETYFTAIQIRRGFWSISAIDGLLTPA